MDSPPMDFDPAPAPIHDGPEFGCAGQTGTATEREEAMNLATKVESRDQTLRERVKRVIPGGMSPSESMRIRLLAS